MKSLSPLKRETTLTKLVILVMMTFLNVVSVESIRFFYLFLQAEAVSAHIWMPVWGLDCAFLRQS